MFFLVCFWLGHGLRIPLFWLHCQNFQGSLVGPVAWSHRE